MNYNPETVSTDYDESDNEISTDTEGYVYQPMETEQTAEPMAVTMWKQSRGDDLRSGDVTSPLRLSSEPPDSRSAERRRRHIQPIVTRRV